MKKVRIILRIVLALVVLLVAAVVAVALLADRAVRRAVESAGTRVLTVRMTVDTADVSILGGSLELRGVTVANPPRYSGKALVMLQEAVVTADARSLLGDEVLIRDLRLNDMELFVEQRGIENNLYEIVNVLRARPASVGKKLIIDRLVITDIRAHVDLPSLPGQPQRVTIPVDPIEMTGLGRDERLDTAVLISKIILAVAAGVAERSEGVLPKETVDGLTGILDKVIDIGREIFGPGRKKEDQQPGDTDLGRKVTEGLKDLIGSKQKDQ